MLEEYVEDNYYARFDTITAALLTGEQMEIIIPMSHPARSSHDN